MKVDVEKRKTKYCSFMSSFDKLRMTTGTDRNADVTLSFPKGD